MNVDPDRLWQSTFQPDHDLTDFDALREDVLAQRTSLGLDALKKCNEVLTASKGSGLPESFLELMEGEQGSNTLVYDDPVFSIWLRFYLRALANRCEEELALHISKLATVFEDVERRLTGKAKVYVPGSLIAVQCADLSPYVMAATPPTYDFTRLPAWSGDDSTIGHPLRLQADLVRYALGNINAVWPELNEQINECVRIFGYLPDATFRSCSAARYSGIVYLGNMDESLLDIEESLVHETGHQVLYQLGELTRLTVPDTPLEANYVLPWSNSRRDLFGFLHAYYIYALLVKYYWRRAKLNEHDAYECHGRAMLILAGSLIATRTLKDETNLTEQGSIIVDRIAEELEALHAEVRKDFAKDEEGANGDANS